MEDTLRVNGPKLHQKKQGLNPCFNGRYSQRLRLAIKFVTKSLNPCFNGRYSQSKQVWVQKKQVSISFNPCFNGRYSQSQAQPTLTWELSCFNPCFNGRYSQSHPEMSSVDEAVF